MDIFNVLTMIGGLCLFPVSYTHQTLPTKA